MTEAPEDQAGCGHFIDFVVHPPIPGKMWDEKQAPARPDHGEDQPIESGRLIMRKQSDQRPEPSAALRLWTYEAALSAVPYLRAVVRSLREHWLHVQSVRRQIQRLDSRLGRPDRQTLIRRAVAVQELDHADAQLEETFDELKAIDVFCLDPAVGLALIPFGKRDELAWYVFDLFAPQGLEAWRFQSDPLEMRRPLEQNAGSELPTRSA
jgi:hypothetical protein